MRACSEPDWKRHLTSLRTSFHTGCTLSKGSGRSERLYTDTRQRHRQKEDAGSGVASTQPPQASSLGLIGDVLRVGDLLSGEEAQDDTAVTLFAQ